MIRNIWAVGRNYADHAKELGNAIPTQPLFFLKSGSCLVLNSSELQFPTWATEIHHELELAFQVDQNLNICAWGLALDLTERNLQNELKSKGQPWTLSKSFVGACPLSPLRADITWDQLKNEDLTLKINHIVRQNEKPKTMIHKPEQLLEFVKTHFPLCPEDLILTGTPAGVGPLRTGDLIEASLGAHLKAHWVVK